VKTPSGIPPVSLDALKSTFRMIAAGGIETDPLKRAPKISDVRALARKRLPRMAFDFVDGAADAEHTLRANESDLARVTFRTVSMRDVSTQDLSATVVGQKLPLPVIAAPTGLIRIAGGEGELAAVRAAGRAGMPFTISTASSYSMEEIAEHACGPLWFQLYMWRSEKVVDHLVQRARKIGASALVVTIDVAVNGKRARDHRNGMSIPPKVTLGNAASVMRHPRWFAGLLSGPPIGFRNLVGIAEGSSAMSHQEYVNTELSNLSASWDDIASLRRKWDGALIVKGIMSEQDAQDALRVGADAVWVSNHGGRQLDSQPSTISVLPRIADVVEGRADIIFDSGIRQGADVAKALSLGATATAIGRPWVYGLAAAGDRGMAHVADILATELAETLILLGRPRAEELDRSCVRIPAEWLP
jgi:L-lactate dehydrogenase (cytochrome)